MMPKNTPCNENKPCKLCKIATKNDKDKWEKRAREKNLSYYKQAKRYHDECFDRFQQLEMSVKNMKAVENILKDLEATWNNIEIEIDTVTKQADKLILWKDIYFLYEKMYITICLEFALSMTNM